MTEKPITPEEGQEALDAARIRYRIAWARSMKRVWYYDRASRQPTAEDPTWRSSPWPWFGDDEYGRKTIVLPIPFHGQLVWAFWTWTDKEADEVREQTMQEERITYHDNGRIEWPRHFYTGPMEPCPECGGVILAVKAEVHMRNPQLFFQDPTDEEYCLGWKVFPCCHTLYSRDYTVTIQGDEPGKWIPN